MNCPKCGVDNPSTAVFCGACGKALEIRIEVDRAAYNTPVAPGTIFEDKYQVLEEIGRGGMGVVYKGHDLSLGRMVAIKVLPEQFNTDDEVIARFKREARAMAALDHPNVVPVYAIGQQRMFHYFVMKFLSGSTVAEILDRQRKTEDPRFPPRQARKILMKVCQGLGHAHKRGLIHRDIKPGNIMVGAEGEVTIMDFGIVKEEAGGEALTRTGLVFGTPEYMAPEQAQGSMPPGPPTDIYSLGVVGYEMLSGLPPFRGETPFSIVLKHIKEPPAPLVEAVPGVSPALQAVIFRALEKRPGDRYPDAREMLAELDDVDLERRRSSVVTLAPPKGLGMPVGPIATPLRAGPEAERPVAGLSEGPLTQPGALSAPPVTAPSVSTPPPVGSGSLPPQGTTPGGGPAVGPRTLPPEVAVGRTPVPHPVRVASGTRRVAPAAEQVGVVDDRPGHYRQVITARARRQVEQRRRHRRLWVGVALVLVLMAGVALIALAVSRHG